MFTASRASSALATLVPETRATDPLRTPGTASPSSAQFVSAGIATHGLRGVPPRPGPLAL
jgi:hypothetical protein